MMHTELINKTRDHSRVWRCSTVRVVSGLTVKYIQEVFITTNVPKHDSSYNPRLQSDQSEDSRK